MTSTAIQYLSNPMIWLVFPTKRARLQSAGHGFNSLIRQLKRAISSALAVTRKSEDAGPSGTLFGGCPVCQTVPVTRNILAVSYTHLRAHETPEHLVCLLLLEKK